MSTGTRTDTELIELLDFAPPCGARVGRISMETGKLIKPGEPCDRAAEWTVIKHTYPNCRELPDMVCDEHLQYMKGHTCRECGRQIYRNWNPL